MLYLSKCCKNLPPCDCFSFAIFVRAPWECSAPSCAWLPKLSELHELGISLDHHLRTSFVVSLHSLGHSGGSQIERKRQIFSIGLSQFSLNLLYNHLNRCYAWEFVGMYNNSTKFYCNRMGIGWDTGDFMHEAKQGQDATLTLQSNDFAHQIKRHAFLFGIDTLWFGYCLPITAGPTPKKSRRRNKTPSNPAPPSGSVGVQCTNVMEAELEYCTHSWWAARQDEIRIHPTLSVEFEHKKERE